MKKFDTDQLTRFFQAVDRHLTHPFELVVIGGSAALLGYGAQRVTDDIDMMDPSYRRIQPAIDAAKEETLLDIHMEHAAVADPPYSYKERLRTADIPGLEKLTITIPERHDLVLMKTARGQEPDLQVAEEIHRNHPLDADLLIDRWVNEMSQTIGDPRRLDGNFLVLLERLFGDEVVDRARKQLHRKT